MRPMTWMTLFLMACAGDTTKDTTTTNPDGGDADTDADSDSDTDTDTDADADASGHWVGSCTPNSGTTTYGDFVHAFDWDMNLTDNGGTITGDATLALVFGYGGSGGSTWTSPGSGGYTWTFPGSGGYTWTSPGSGGYTGYTGSYGGYTYYPYNDFTVTGTFDGSAIDVALNSQGFFGSDLSMDGTIAGDTWTGRLIDAGGYFSPYDCTLTR